MIFIKKIIIVFIVLITTYIIWRLIMKQQELSAQKTSGFSTKGSFTEGFLDASGNSTSYFPTFSSADAEFLSVKKTLDLFPITILNSPPKYDQIPIYQMEIKAAYNSAITGNFVHKNMVQYIIQRGCRYLDFELFFIDDDVVVSYTTDPTYQTIMTDNTITLNDMLATIVSQGFSQIAPNKNDPLFICFRIKSTEPTIYQHIAKSVDHAFKLYLFSEKINTHTTMAQLQGKIILINDSTLNPHNYLDLCNCTDPTNCYNYSKQVNVEMGIDTLIQQPYMQILGQTWQPPLITQLNPPITDVKKWRLIVPDKPIQPKNQYANPPKNSPLLNQNPQIAPFIRQFGCQIVPFRFYLLDSTSIYSSFFGGSTPLADYETLFNDQKTAFVPMANALTYFSQ
jgi:hypothetical protein